MAARPDLPSVLLVDDRRENLLALEAVLGALPCRLVSVTSGEDALKRLLVEDFALIVLDVQMPDLDGFETARYIRGRERTRAIPIIFVTAISKAPQNVFKGYEAGAVDYLFKPYDPQLLRGKVKVFLELDEHARSLARSEAALRTTFECAPIGMARLDAREVIVQANRALAETLGRTREELCGRSLRSLVHGADLELDAEQRTAMLAGQLAGYDVELRMLHLDGTLVPCLTSVSVLGAEDGRPTGYVVQLQDVGERRRAEEEREALVQAQAARHEAERVSARLLALNRLADAALGTLELEPLLDELLRRLTDVLDVDAAAALLRDEQPGRARLFHVAAGTGAPVRRRMLDDDEAGLLAEVAAGNGALALADARATSHPLGGSVASLLALPLGDGAAPVGTLAVGSLFPREFSDEDRDLLALAGERAALAIERARVFERERSIAQRLQRSLLPSRLPDVPGLTLAARYMPGGAGTQVGGDWYDTVRLPGDRLLLVMGDIAGRGVEAAATMGQLRSAVRAYALAEPDPGAIPARLNDFVGASCGDTMVTLVLAVVDLAAGTLSYVNAGHPPPLLVQPDGESHFLRGGLGVPLGVLEDPAYEEAEEVLGLGATVVLYTDGVVERPGEDLGVGFERLRAAVDGPVDDPEPLCDAILARALSSAVGSDDVTLMAVRAASPCDPLCVLPLPGTPQALGAVRSNLRDWLSEASAAVDEIQDITLAANEACQNAIEHAERSSTGPARVELERDSGLVTIRVRDRGRWRAGRRPARGRGLPLMRALMESVEVDKGADGSTVTLRRRLRGAPG